jgi:predicted RNA-binding Zn ribbon-like protein
MTDVTAIRPAAPPPLDLIVGLVNTLDLETGEEHLPDSRALRQWLVERRLMRRSDPVTSHDLEDTIRLREILRRALRSDGGRGRPAPAARDLNRLAQRAPLLLTFTGDASVGLEPTVSGFDGALGRIMAAVFEAIRSGAWQRLKVCANERCQWAFYDASKNRSARWCEMADCGNDAKGRAYRARRRASAASGSTR